jgi:pimeloyl-ACP methyl ester carboxylesterase
MAKPDRTRIAGITKGFRELGVRIGNIDLNYVEGPDNGIPLLLIPGQMESWQGYKCVMPELSRKFHVFIPDLRGHGKSTRTPGQYSYNICGNDLVLFIREVIRKPAVVGGLSSGGVLALWLAANLPDQVLAVISEDPPIFSSIWPRIQEEKFMANNFKLAVDNLGEADRRDLTNIEKYLSQTAVPVKGKPELLKIPRFIVKFIISLAKLTRATYPERPFDLPFMPFNLRAGYKFLSEYDIDFSRATLDGRLSEGFSPEDTLKRIKCPVLLLRASAYRHETWGLIGAMDNDDLERMKMLIKDLKVVQMSNYHEIHMMQPLNYVLEVATFIEDLQTKNKLIRSWKN